MDNFVRIKCTAIAERSIYLTVYVTINDGEITGGQMTCLTGKLV